MTEFVCLFVSEWERCWRFGCSTLLSLLHTPTHSLSETIGHDTPLPHTHTHRIQHRQSFSTSKHTHAHTRIYCLHEWTLPAIVPLFSHLSQWKEAVQRCQVTNSPFHEVIVLPKLTMERKRREAGERRCMSGVNLNLWKLLEILTTEWTQIQHKTHNTHKINLLN